MGEYMPMTAADVAAVTRNNDGYGDGMWGGGCWWIIIFVLFAFMGRGWNNNDGCCNDCCGDRIAEEFTQRDIFNTNQNVSNTGMQLMQAECQTQRDVLENRYTTQLGFTQAMAQAKDCCCETQRTVDNARFDISKEVLQNRYDNALQTQTISAQMAECCCDLKTAIHAEGENTRALITANTIQELRDNLQAAQLQLGNVAQTNNLISALRPTPIPAYITCSPYQSYGFNGYNGFGFGNNCGCGCSGCGC